MSSNTILSGGVTTTAQQELTITDLMPNNYLTIVWGDAGLSTMLKDLNVDEKTQKEIENNIQNALTRSIESGKIKTTTPNSNRNKYINVTSVAKYLAQNTIPSGPRRIVANALIGLASGGGSRNIINEKTTNLAVNMFGSIAKNTARDLGFTDPHEMFAGISSENTIKFFQNLGKRTQEKIDDKIKELRGIPKTNTTSQDSKDSGKKYVGLVIGLTHSDTESYEITIPRRKVENGSDYTTHLLPQPFKKEFSGTITNKLLLSKYDAKLELESIEYVKNKLIEIAQSHTTFDIYIRLSADKMYKKTNVVFSSLSFTKDENSGMGYSFSFTVEPIEEFKVKTFVSDRKYFPTSSSSTSGVGKTKGKGATSSVSGNVKTTNNGNVITVKHVGGGDITPISIDPKKGSVYSQIKAQGKVLASTTDCYGRNIYQYLNPNETIDYNGVPVPKKYLDLKIIEAGGYTRTKYVLKSGWKLDTNNKSITNNILNIKVVK